MVKRVFKIIGIVLASVTAFTGAVLGVMALMGKFKKPIIYPDSLQFVDSEQTVVFNGYKINGEDYGSFTLNGFSNSGNQVNQKNCYLYFDNNIGADLITLYDKVDDQYVKLEAINNRYLIECDEPVYYQVKENISDSHYAKVNFGKIVLKARDEKNQIQSNTLTIWLDREVTDIALVTDRGLIEDDTQGITLGLDGVQEFEFVATPEHSLRPISKEESKEIEIYYVDPAKTDYVRITDNVLSEYSFLNKQDDTYIFSTDVAGTYRFMIATFASYADKAEYISNINNVNHSNFERVAQMITKAVNITVVNSDISEVVMNTSNVGFDIYSNNNYITLNGGSNVNLAKDNNLQLIMKDEDNNSTSLRFNEVVYGVGDNSLSQRNVEFVNINNVEDFFIYTNTEGANKLFDIKLTQNNFILNRYEGNVTTPYTINLDNKTVVSVINNGNSTINNTTIKRTIINSISYQDTTYVSGSDIIVLTQIGSGDDATYILERLLSGSYLGLYEVSTKDATTSYSPATFNYSVNKPINSDNSKSWNVVVMEEPKLKDNTKIQLGILVVNNSGDYVFHAVDVMFTTVALSYEFLAQEHDLTVSYGETNEGHVRVMPELSADDIVEIKAGTYNACVFVTPVNIDGKYDIDVLENVTYTIADNTYCLVGYFNGVDFVNRVRVRTGATNIDTKIYMLQLKNEYTQSASNTVENYLYNYSSFTFEEKIIAGDDQPREIVLTYRDGKFYTSIDNEEFEYSFTSNSNEIIINGVTYIFKQVNFIAPTIEELEDGDGNNSNPNSISISDIVVASFLTVDKAIDININYSLNADTVTPIFKLTIIENGEIEHGISYDESTKKYYVNEDSNGYVLYFSSTNGLMLKDILSTGQYSISARLYYNNTNEKTDVLNFNIDEVDFVTEEDSNPSIKIPFDVKSFDREDDYIIIEFTYNGITLESDHLYIKNTEPNDINLNSEIFDENTLNLDLASKDADALEKDVYIKIEVGYDVNTNKYTYIYYLMNGSEIIATETTDINNILKSGNGGWFLVEPNIVNHIIDTFASRDSSVFTLDSEALEGGKTYKLEVKSLNTTTMGITAGGVTRTIKIVTTAADGFEFATKYNNTDTDTSNDTTIKSNEFNIANLITYSYNGVPIVVNDSNVQVEMQVLSSGAGATKVITNNKNIYVVLTSYEGTDYENNYLLKLYNKTNSNNTTPEESGTIPASDMRDEIVTTTGNWVLVRNSNYENTTFTIKLILSTLTHQDTDKASNYDNKIELTLAFDSSITVNNNSQWNSTEVYTGTDILLAIEYTSATDTVIGNNTPVYLVKNDTGGNTFAVEVYNSNGYNVSVLANDKTYPYTNNGFTYMQFDEAGKYTIRFTLSGSSTIVEKTLIVLPNAILTNYEEEINSYTNYQLSDIVTVKAFDNTVVYGESGVQFLNEYGNYTNYLNATVSDSELSISVTPNTALEKTSDKYRSQWIDTLNSSTEMTIELYYHNYKINNGSLTININNSISSDVDELDIMANDVIDIVQKLSLEQNLTNKGTITFTDQNIGNGFTVIAFADNDNTIYKLKYNGDVTIPTRFDFTDSGLTLSWTRDAVQQTLIWKGSIVVNPYIPDIKKQEDLNKIYSNHTYDFLDEFFDLTDNDKSIIKEIRFESNDDKVIFTTTGYNSDGSTNTATANIKSIAGDSYTAKIKVYFVYKSGDYYTHDLNVSIENRHDLELYYPFNDDGLKTSTLNYYIENDVDALEFANNVNVNKVYSISGQPYEPILVNKTIDFANDEYLRQRAYVYDKINESYISNTIANISVVGYQNKGNLKNTINITTDGTKVTFGVTNNFSAGSNLIVILKITTTEGDYGYYFVYLYNNASGVAPNLNQTNVVGKDLLSTNNNKYISNNTLLNGVTLDTSFFNTNYSLNVNYSSYIQTYLFEAVDINGNPLDDEDWFTRVEDKNIPIITEYIKITLGFLYVEYNAQFYIGSYTVNVAPVVHEEFIDNDNDLIDDINGLTRLNSGHSTGEYTKTLNINDDTYNQPFTLTKNDYLFSSAVLVEDTDIVSVDQKSGLISINSYPTENYDFSVIYTFNENAGNGTLTLKVYYTLEGYVFDNTTQSFTVGAYDTNSNTFVNTLEFNKIMGDYEREFDIEVSYNRSDINNVVEKNDELKLFTFDQNTAQYIATIKITMTKLQGTPTKTINVTVLSNVHTVQNSGVDSGYDGSSAKSTLSTGLAGFKSAVGSTLNIGRIPVEGNENIVKYIIAGLTIYLPVGTGEDIDTLEISAGGYEQYIINFAGGRSFTVTNTTIVNFTHTAESVIIPLTIKVKRGDNDYQTTDSNGNLIDLELRVFVRAVATYDRLEAVYVWKGSQYETIVSENSQNDLINTLFSEISTVTGLETDANRLSNNRRINLVYTDSDRNEQLVSDYDPTVMGFIGSDNTNNPNYISVTPGEYLTYRDGALTASKVTTRVDTGIILENNSGVELEYDYYILPDDTLLNYTTEVFNGTLDNGTSEDLEDDIDYASILINDPSDANDTDYMIEYSTTKAIGTLRDENNNILHMTVTNETESTAIDKSVVVNRIDNVFTFNVSDYNFIITYNNQTKLISIEVLRGRDIATRQAKFIFDLRLYLEGSATPYIQRLAIYNAKVYGNWESGEDIYGASAISLLENNRVVAKSNTGSEIGINYKLLTNGESYYNVGSNSRIIITNSTNLIYSYDIDSSLITTKSVGERVIARNEFKVEAEGYYLGNVVYTMNILPNYEFRVKATDTDNGIIKEGNTKERNYTFDQTQLSIKDNEFFYELNLIDELGLSLYSKTGIERDLLDLAVINTESTIIGVSVSGATVIFTRNYSDELLIELNIPCGSNGTYTQYLAINITGFTEFDYTGDLLENTIFMRDNKEAFLSGSIVTPIAQSSREGVGIIMDRQRNEDGSILDYINNENADVKFNINFSAEYMITENSTEIDVDTLDWTNTSNVDVVYDNAYGVSLILPSVETSSSPIKYFIVTIKFTMSYVASIDNENITIYNETSYVAYRVYNISSISVNSAFSSGVNVDKHLKDKDLQLFYFAEVYNATNTAEDGSELSYRFTKILTNDKDQPIQLKVENLTDQTVLDLSRDTEDLNKFTNDEYTAIFRESSDNTIVEFGGTLGSAEYIVDKTTSGTVGNADNVYFDTNVLNIDAFKVFVSDKSVQFAVKRGLVDGYTNANVTYDKDKNTLDYTLEHLGNGVWGIKLGKGPLFNNELIADLNIVSNGKVINSVPAYSKDSGFKLTTDNAITANTTDVKVGSMFIETWLNLNDTSLKVSDVMGYNIIGVTANNPNTAWTNKANDIDTENAKLIATFRVPNGTANPTEYYLYLGNFKADETGNALYSLSADFYYIVAGSTDGEIIVPYYARSDELNMFKVAYGNSLNLTNKLLVYSMNEKNKLLVPSHPIIANLSRLDNNDEVTYAFENNAISVNLDTYKEIHPDDISVKLKFSTTYNNTTIILDVEFMLY